MPPKQSHGFQSVLASSHLKITCGVIFPLCLEECYNGYQGKTLNKHSCSPGLATLPSQPYSTQAPSNSRRPETPNGLLGPITMPGVFLLLCLCLNCFTHEKHGSPPFNSYLIDQLFNAPSPAPPSPTQNLSPFQRSQYALIPPLWCLFCWHFSSLSSAILTSLISVSPGAPSTVYCMQSGFDIC